MKQTTFQKVGDDKTTRPGMLEVLLSRVVHDAKFGKAKNRLGGDHPNVYGLDKPLSAKNTVLVPV